MIRAELVQLDDHGDLHDLRARLESLREDGDRRLVTHFGSGLSNAIIPNVKQMTDLFRSYMPRAGVSSFDAIISPIAGTGLAYQNAAALLKRQRGDATLARAIRHAVLYACEDIAEFDRENVARDIEECRRLERDAQWRVPDGYRHFARYLSMLPGSLRGPILTTNFDPLLEIALKQCGIDVAPIPIPRDSAPTVEQIQVQQALPVLHLHGYWTSNSTLSTIGQLTKPRPSLTGLLRHLLRHSITLIVAYGGWRDAFMSSLEERVSESDLLEAELLWAEFENDASKVAENSTLHALQYQPGFTLYLGIDGNQIFELTDTCEPDVSTPKKISPYGYSILPIHGSQKERIRADFVEGRQPTWHDASPDAWPWLDATRELHMTLTQTLHHDGGGGVVALGPMGEGKSLALMQVAVNVALATDWTVLWREPGAPPMDAKWFENARQTLGRVLVCVDDADLVTSELVASKDVWSARSSGISLLLASQDRLWSRGGAAFQGSIRSTYFHGLSEADARTIAKSWADVGLLVCNEADRPEAIAQTARQLLASSKSMLEGKETTLFGAVLDVRYGTGLSDRVRDLLHKFKNIRIRADQPITLADIFQVICLMQETYDRYGQLRRGASRPLIAALVGLETVFVDGKILELLGREAAVTYAADRIYSRHPAIARAVVDSIRSDGSIVETARMVSGAGARLRTTGGLSEADYKGAYLIARELHEPREAFAAAEGALTAAPDLLEPRVTFLKVLRKHNSKKAVPYATALGKHIRDYKDFGAAIRAFLVESSHVVSSDGAAQLGVGLAALALHDSIGFNLDARRAQYALVALAKASRDLKLQNASAAPGLTGASAIALERLVGSDIAWKFLAHIRRDFEDVGAVSTRQLSASSLCMRIIASCSKFAQAAITTLGLDLDGIDRLSLVDLQRLISTSNSRRS